MKKSILQLAISSAVVSGSFAAVLPCRKVAAAKAEKVPNYTAEQTAEIVKAYTANKSDETVKKLAEQFGKTTRSIVAKLSREGVYQKKGYTTKDGSAPQSKDDIVQEIAKVLGVSEDKLNGMEKATKGALQLFLYVAETAAALAEASDPAANAPDEIEGEVGEQFAAAQ